MNDQTIQAALDTAGTPLYLFDEEEFHRQSLHLRSLLPSDAELCYAIKANPFIIEQAARDADRVEVCSPGELRICQALGISAGKLVISGVHKDERTDRRSGRHCALHGRVDPPVRPARRSGDRRWPTNPHPY